MTPQEYVRRHQVFRLMYVKTVLETMDRHGRFLVQQIPREFMQRLGKGAPANAPPGPLGIRSGRLVRTLRAEPARVIPGPAYQIRILAGGQDGVEYGNIHEKGGLAGRGHKVRIEARPYMAPAKAKYQTKLNAEIKAAVTALQIKLLKEGA